MGAEIEMKKKKERKKKEEEKRFEVAIEWKYMWPTCKTCLDPLDFFSFLG